MCSTFADFCSFSKISKHNFPAHIVKLWTPGASEYSFNLTEPLKHGFEQTGIFPFSPHLLRSTVKPHLQLQDSSSTQADECYNDIAQILRDRLLAGDDKTETCLAQIKHVLQGGSMGSVIATEFHRHLLRSAPQKKRKEKDSRLSTDNGKVLTDQTYILAKQNQLLNNKKKAAKKSLSNRKRNVPAQDKVHETALPVQKKKSSARLSSVKKNQAEAGPVKDTKSDEVSNDETPLSARKTRAKKAASIGSSQKMILPKPRRSRAKKQC